MWPFLAEKAKKYPEALIIFIGFCFYLPFLGASNLFDWDEINFAEAAREMVITGNYSTVTIDFKPFWEKPPLFFWMQAFFMKIFGISEFASRLPNAIAGVLTLICLYKIGTRQINKDFGWLLTGAYLVTFLPFVYFKSGIIDPWFNLFIFLGFVNAIELLVQKSIALKPAFLSGLFIGLAVLTKGPVGLLLFALSLFIFMALQRFKLLPNMKQILVFTLGLILLGSVWMVFEILNGRFYIIQDFFTYQIRLLSTPDAGHDGPIYYHLIVLLIGCFPLSAFIFLRKNTEIKSLFTQAMWVLLIVVLLVFSLVKTKIIHYSSLCYLPLVYLATLHLKAQLKNNRINLLAKWIIVFTGFFWVLIFFLIPLFSLKNSWFVEFLKINDVFTLSTLKQPSPFGYFDFIPAFVLLFTLLFFLFHKKNNSKILTLFIGSAITLFLGLVLFIPKIEKYSQGGAIHFYKQAALKQQMVYPLGYKSYAHLYYGKKQPNLNTTYYHVDSVLTDTTITNVKFVTKKNLLQKNLKKHTQLQVIDSLGGYFLLEKK